MTKNRFTLPVLISSLTFFLVFFLWMDSSFSITRVFQIRQKDSLRQKYAAWHKNWPMERLFLQTDKPLYNPGEIIWFSVFMAEESRLSKPSLSDIVYVEILNPKGSIEKTFTLIGKGGKANGDFQLSADAPGGIYKLKTYTRYMQNAGRETIREIQVQETVLPQLKLTLELDRQAYKAGDPVSAVFTGSSLDNKPMAGSDIDISIVAGSLTLFNQQAQTDAEGKFKIQCASLPAFPAGSSPVLNVLIQFNGETESITKTIPTVDKDLLVYFFPEGGDFVQNQTGRIAFKVMKPDSTSADAEGWLVNQKGEKLKAVKTLHRGMGSFELTPKAGEQYRIEWTSPLAYSSALPEALEKGYSLSAKVEKDAVRLSAGAPVSDNLLLVAEMRGRWLWDQTLKSVTRPEDVRIPVDKWPAGVVKFSLFDGRGLLRCERMVFVNADKQLKISVKTDKERYQTRDKVTVNVRASDQRGIPVPGQISLSVVSDALLGYADDKQGNLVSGMLLEQDLNTKLEHPTFYFSKDTKANAALDLVMMTYGWRGLSWKRIIEDPLEKPGMQPEKAVISGTLINSMENKALRGAKMEIGKTVVYTDSNGAFRFPFIDLTKPVAVKISKGKERVEEQFISRYSDQMILYYNPYPVVYDRMVPMAAMADNNVMEGAVLEKGGERVMRRNPVPGKPKDKAVKAKAPEGAAKKDMKGFAMDAEAGPPMREPQLKRRPGRMAPVPPPVEESPYHLVRSFPNLPPAKTTERTDFKTTLYWSGIVDLDPNGRGSYSFYTGDDITSYKALVQGMGPDGLLGTGQTLFFTELPFSISTKIPVELSIGDQANLPVMVKNKTNQTRTFTLQAEMGSGIKVEKTLPASVSLKPGESKELPLPVSAVKAMDSCKVRLAISSGEDVDSWEKHIRIVSKGYPVSVSVSGREMTKYFNAEVRNLVPGSLDVHVTAFPDVTSDLLKGVESILSEPYGCFEQTSMTSYPNVLVLNYLKQSSNPNPALVSNAEVLLEKGYKRLTSFETKQKGYEWFGGTPAHEALTAYGLMQFKEMQKVAPYVDGSMIDRTATWLMSRRDGKGGFMRSSQALDNFGRASDDITNAYIVYSMAEAGSQQLDLEVKKTTEVALAKKDPYMLALAANTLWLLKQPEKAREVTKVLLSLQANDGSWTGLTHSITYSTGQALTVETTGFSILALIRSEETDKNIIDKAVQFLCSQRAGGGGFGNSQATIVALKALTAYVVFSKRAVEDGAFTLMVNDKEAAKADWKAGVQKSISVKGWENTLKEGQNKLEFTYSVLKDPLPFTVGIDYFTSLPPSDPNCKVSLTTKLSAAKVAVGKPVQMEIQLKNNTKDGLPMTMACVSVPGGCVVSPVQFRELMDAKKVDFYEVKGNKVFLYYRQMIPSEIKNIVLTLTPVIKGKYESSASSAYLYYTAEHKIWSAGLPLVIE